MFFGHFVEKFTLNQTTNSGNSGLLRNMKGPIIVYKCVKN